MSTDIQLTAEVRQDVGKGASRRLRRLADKVPAIVYGGGKEPLAITFVHKDIMKAAENEAFYSQILQITLDGKKQALLLKDIQRHPYKKTILHLDFQRITGKEKLHVNIPLHFINEETAPAVKQGGIISHLVKDMEVITTPANLPEFLEVDLGQLELEQIIHLSDVPLPEGVESAVLAQGKEYDQPVASAHKPKIKAEVEEEETTTEAEAETTDNSKPEGE